jgi:nitrate/nitrite-specific signal transduction histidine kinase
VDSVTPKPGHLGITAIRERAELAGGWLKISSIPGSGTVVEFWIPALTQRQPDQKEHDEPGEDAAGR